MKNPTSFDLESFANNIFEEKKYPKDLDKDVSDQIKNDILSALEDRINAVIINNLPEDKLKTFSEMLDREDLKDEDVQKFCSENIKNLEELIVAELIVFKQSYLS